MSRPARSRPILLSLAATAAVTAAVVVVGTLNRPVRGGEADHLRGRRVVIFTMPGVTWADIGSARTPTFDRLVRQGASAALAVRTAGVQPSAVRGYITLGAGNRGAAPGGSAGAQEAYMADEEVNTGVTADELLTTRVGPHRKGTVVHLGYAELARLQKGEYHGTVIGALGEALAEAGVSRGIVSAGDHGNEPDPPDVRRGAPVLAMVDASGVVQHGRIAGLVEPDPDSPYGVRTDRGTFVRAVAGTLGEARVVLVEPGETLRADVSAPEAFPETATRARRRALERTDGLLRDVVELLDDDDVLLVLGPSSTGGVRQEHLTPMVAWGDGVEAGALVSATTHRPGQVTLTDVAPTVLSIVGVDQPPSMSGRPMRSTPAEGMARPSDHQRLDMETVFRDTWSPSVFYAFIGLFVVWSLLIGLVFLLRARLEVPLLGMCYLILAVPVATFVVAVLPLWRIGIPAAHIVLWSVSVVLAGAGWLISRPRWVGAIPLFVALAVFEGVALLLGGQALVNAVFGNSVVVAGRFYGIGNTGWALFFGSGVLALAGLGEIVRARRWNVWLALGLIVMLVITGAPPFGADVGGLLTGISSAIVILVVGRDERIAWRAVAIGIVAATAVTLLVAFLDSLRDPDAQTHLGRFFESLFSGDATARTTLWRKATQAMESLSISRFSYIVLLGVGALGVLLRRPRGPLRDVLPAYPLFRAAFAGLLVAGVLGFLLNDSGVVVPALLLAQGVPLVVVLAVDHARSPANP